MRAAVAGLALRAAPPRRRVRPGSVALTFDDGPDPHFTDRVLDVLAAHDAVATFFLVGRAAEQHPELVRRIGAAGHAIGSHTFGHADAERLTWRALVAEYRAGRRAVERILGARVRLFRPPFGHYGPRPALAARVAGLEPWLWTVDPLDWEPGVSAATIAARCDAGSADVVLLHDGLQGAVRPEAQDRSATVTALPDLISSIRGRGLDLVRLERAA